MWCKFIYLFYVLRPNQHISFTCPFVYVSSIPEKGVLVGVNYTFSRLHVSAGSGTAAAPEPANQAQAIKNLPWPIWRMPASGEEQANEEGAPPSIEKTPKHTEDAAKKVFPDTTSLAQAADKTQAKTSSKMWIFKAPTKPRSHLFLVSVSLACLVCIWTGSFTSNLPFICIMYRSF